MSATLAGGAITCEWGAYSHTARIDLLDGETCDICHEQRRVAVIDTSNEEYAALKMCADCAGRIFDPAFLAKVGS
jgi:hypothetical protein